MNDYERFGYKNDNLQYVTQKGTNRSLIDCLNWSGTGKKSEDLSRRK